MMEDCIDISIIKVKSPSDFIIREVAALGMSDEARAYRKLIEDLNKYFENDQIIKQAFTPQKGQVYAGKRLQDTNWYRVRVETCLDRRNGLHASCFLLDDGKLETIPIQSLRMIPSDLQHTKVPYQIKRCSLYGVRPLTLSLSPTATPVYSVCDVWDNSAVQRMKQLIKESAVRKAQVMRVTPDGIYQVNLYLETAADRWFCLNERLIQEQYCVADIKELSDSEGSVSGSMSSSHSDGLQSFNSSSEVTQGREPRRKTRRDFSSRNIHAELLAEMGLTDEVKVRADNFSGMGPQEHVVSVQRERGTQGKTALSQQLSCGDSCRSSTLLPSPHRQELLCSDTGQGSTGLSNSSAVTDTIPAHLSSPPGTRDGLHTNLPAGFSSGNSASYEVVQNHISPVVPKFLIASDGEASSFSETSMNRNLKLITRELTKLSNGEAFSGSDSDLSVNSDLSLTRYEEHSNRSLKEVVTNLQNKLASKPPSPAPSPQASHNPGPSQPHSSGHSGSSGLNGLSHRSDRSRTPTVPAASHCSEPFHNPRLTGMFGDHPMEASALTLTTASRKPVSPLPEQPIVSGKKTGDTSLSTAHILSPGAGSVAQPNQEQVVIPGDDKTRGNQGLSLVSRTTHAALDGDHAASTTDPNLLDLSVDRLLSGLLSLDPSAPGIKTRRPKLPLNGSDGLTGKRGRSGKIKSPSGRVCFSDDEKIHVTSGTEKRVVKSPKMPPAINQRNIALRSILKKCSVPEEPGTKAEATCSPVVCAPAEDITDRSSVDSSQSDQEKHVFRKAQLGNRILANRLLTQLAGQTKHSQTLDLKTEEPEKYGSWYRPPDGVYVDADIRLRPVETLDGVPFHEQVIKVLRSKKLDSPLLIQSYCWPPILRGRDVIGIAPRNKGQILAYLAPLLTQLIQNRPYPEGGGPLVLIVCSSWRRAQEIQRKCETILGELPLPRVMTIFGGGSEQGYNIPLINGCEILIATPHCLTRKLGKFVNLRRLRHLVIDEAELVMGNFREQVNQVMVSFRDVLIQRGGQSSFPRQLLVFGTHWTSKLESFWDSFMLEPVLVITSQYEAAVFGAVKHFIVMVRAGQRLAKLVESVASSLQMNEKIIVFTDSEEEAKTVYHTLSANSCYVLLATVGADLTPVLREWQLPHKGASCPVLVCTDAVVFDLNVTDANVVMHYGMAKSKTTFGNRMSCAQESYRKSANLKDKTNCPKSYVFVTENCGPMVMSLVDLLERTKCRIPRELRAMVQGMLEGKERENPRPLCYYLKAFGTCKRRSHCKARHVIRPDLDRPRQLTMSSPVPSQGEVKVLVTYVENASRYFVRILQHRALDGKIQQMDTLYNRLHEALQAWFAISDNRFENGPVQYGDLCCYPEEDRYCRVEVQDEGNMEHYATQRHRTVKIFYVDEGRTYEVTASSLLKLPDNFKGIPFQAVEAYLCRISPVDSDTDWVPKADAFMCSQVRDIELWGKIVLSLDGTLWLDPFVERVYHETIKVTTTNTQIRTLLLRRGYAIENPQHLELLYQACKNKMELPDYSRSVLDVEPEVESLPVAGEDAPGEESSDTATPVFMSACYTPECFYLRLAERDQDLEELMSRINRDSGRQRAVLEERKVKAGTLCLAKFPHDDRWCRAQIESVGNNNEVDVLFVDYGDSETVNIEDIEEISDKYLRLPFQAIECGFPDVTPVGSSWQDDDNDALWEMVCHPNGDHRQLLAQVKGRRPAQCVGAHRHLVNLVYMSCDEEVNVLQEMVYRKHCLVDNTSIQPLFPVPVYGEESLSADGRPQRSMDLCRSIYNTLNPLVLRTMVPQLRNMLASVLDDASVADEVKEEVITNLWKLIRYSQHAPVFTTLLAQLTRSLSQCQSLLSSVLEHRLVAQLCWEICRNKSAEVQLSSLRCLLSLCHEELVKVLLAKLENIEALVTAVQKTESVKVKTLGTELLARMCTASPRTMTDVKEEKGIDVVLEAASEHKDDSQLAESFCHFCCVLGDHQKDEYYTDFNKDGLLKLVVQLIRDTDNHQVVRLTTRLMRRLSERSRRNKTLMLEAGYVPVLKGLPQRFPELSAELSSHWNHLLTSLDVKAPREHLSGNCAKVVHGQGRPMDTERSLGKSISPAVSWYQNSFRVVLSVKLTGVTKKTVTYTENSVHFEAVSDGKLYEFELSLCDRIIPSGSHEEVRLKEMLISLKKEQKGRWKRLLRDKEKPSFLSVDFERIQDSSDSDGEDSDDNLFVVKHSTRGKPLPPRSATAKSSEENPGVQRSNSSDSNDSLDDLNYDSDGSDFFKT